MTDQKFRALIALHLALALAAIGAVFLPSSYSSVLSDAYASEPISSFIESETLLLVIGLALLATWVAGLIGLWTFKRWGRSLCLYSTLGALAFVPFNGPSLSTGLETSLYEAASLCWGAVLALAYYSPIREHFNES